MLYKIWLRITFGKKLAVLLFTERQMKSKSTTKTQQLSIFSNTQFCLSYINGNFLIQKRLWYSQRFKVNIFFCFTLLVYSKKFQVRVLGQSYGSLFQNILVFEYLCSLFANLSHCMKWEKTKDLGTMDKRCFISVCATSIRKSSSKSLLFIIWLRTPSPGLTGKEKEALQMV